MDCKELYIENYKHVYYICLKFMKNEHDAEDMAQAVFVKAFDKIDELKDKSKFKNWISQIASRECMNELRHRGIIEFTKDDISEEFKDLPDKSEKTPEEVVIDNDVKDILLELMNKLPQDQRIALYLYYYQDMSVKEISKVFNCPEQSTRNRLGYAKKNLRKYVEEIENKGVKLRTIAILPFLYVLFNAEMEEVYAMTSVPEYIDNSGNVNTGNSAEELTSATNENQKMSTDNVGNSNCNSEMMNADNNTTVESNAELLNADSNTIVEGNAELLNADSNTIVESNAEMMNADSNTIVESNAEMMNADNNTIAEGSANKSKSVKDNGSESDSDIYNKEDKNSSKKNKESDKKGSKERGTGMGKGSKLITGMTKTKILLGVIGIIAVIATIIAVVLIGGKAGNRDNDGNDNGNENSGTDNITGDISENEDINIEDMSFTNMGNNGYLDYSSSSSGSMENIVTDIETGTYHVYPLKDNISCYFLAIYEDGSELYIVSDSEKNGQKMIYGYDAQTDSQIEEEVDLSQKPYIEIEINEGLAELDLQGVYMVKKGEIIEELKNGISNESKYDLNSGFVYIKGKKIDFPCVLQDIKDEFPTVRCVEYDDKTQLEPNSYGKINWYDTNYPIDFYIINDTEDTKPIEQCKVIGIHVNSIDIEDYTSIVFPGYMNKECSIDYILYSYGLMHDNGMSKMYADESEKVFRYETEDYAYQIKFYNYNGEWKFGGMFSLCKNNVITSMDDFAVLCIDYLYNSMLIE